MVARFYEPPQMVACRIITIPVGFFAFRYIYKEEGSDTMQLREVTLLAVLIRITAAFLRTVPGVVYLDEI